LVSDGRAEFGTGRSNSIITMDAMGVDPTETRAQWNESLDFIVQAMTEEQVEFHGKYWDMKTPVYLTPKPLQNPHPPIYVATTSLEMHKIAGEKGIGAMAWDSYFGWDYAEECARIYQKEIAAPTKQVGKFVTNSLSFLVLPAYCAETKKDAMEQGGPTTIEFFHAVIEIYKNLAKRSPDYKYMDQIEKIQSHINDIDYVQSTTPGLMVGTPDYFIEQITRLQALGYDEVILRLDGIMKHEELMRSIELIGKYVIPTFKSPNNIVTGGLLDVAALA
ncbi:MAG: LLM class flavin-dependent oxidoreductase, partial [Alphaproteobacteria bacterium]